MIVYSCYWNVAYSGYSCYSVYHIMTNSAFQCSACCYIFSCLFCCSATGYAWQRFVQTPFGRGLSLSPKRCKFSPRVCFEQHLKLTGFILLGRCVNVLTCHIGVWCLSNNFFGRPMNYLPLILCALVALSTVTAGVLKNIHYSETVAAFCGNSTSVDKGSYKYI